MTKLTSENHQLLDMFLEIVLDHCLDRFGA